MDGHFQATLDPRKQELLEARFLGARVSVCSAMDGDVPHTPSTIIIIIIFREYGLDLVVVALPHGKYLEKRSKRNHIVVMSM